MKIYVHLFPLALKKKEDEEDKLRRTNNEQNEREREFLDRISLCHAL